MNNIMDSGQMPGSLELAYLGDTLWDLYVREKLVKTGGRMRALHNSAVAMVRASAQSEALSRIEGELTEEEADVVRRARNAHQTPPHHAEYREYCRATALEALMGHLYLTGKMGRMRELMQRALPEEIMEGAINAWRR